MRTSKVFRNAILALTFLLPIEAVYAAPADDEAVAKARMEYD